MKRDPRITGLVVRGYLKLALFVGIIIAGVVPVVLFPGVRGIQVALILTGTAGVVIALLRQFAVRPRWPFTVAFVAWSAAQIALAFFVNPGSAIGDAVKQILLLCSVVLMLVVIPKLILKQRASGK